MVEKISLTAFILGLAGFMFFKFVDTSKEGETAPMWIIAPGLTSFFTMFIGFLGLVLCKVWQ